MGFTQVGELTNKDDMYAARITSTDGVVHYFNVYASELRQVAEQLIEIADKEVDV